VAAKQFQNQGSLSLSMALYQAFSAIYVLDYFWHEEAMTSTYVLSYSLDCAKHLAPNVLH
jgi:hypothetical protein